MSLTIIDQPSTPSRATRLTGWSWLAALSASARRRIVRIAERSRARDELLAMDDRMLADIGLHRCDVDYAARSGGRP